MKAACKSECSISNLQSEWEHEELTIQLGHNVIEMMSEI